jgi:hypothetical protein
MDIKRFLWEVAETGFEALTRFAARNGLILYFSKPDAPTPPDYAGAATAEGQAGIQTAIVNSLLNRANQTSPLGSQTWEQTGTTQVPGVGNQPAVTVPNYASSINLTPEGQQLLDADMRQKLGLAGLADTSMGQVASSISSPLDLASTRPNYNQKVADALYDRATRYLDPQWAQGESDERTRLANSGFSQQNEGYGKAIEDFGRRKEFAYGGARDTATAAGEAVGTQQRQQDIAELLLQRQQPLAELNALRTGAQPGMPGFPSTAVGANAQPANIVGATQAQGQAFNDIYGSKVGTYNSNVGAVSNAGLMAYLAYLAA